MARRAKTTPIVVEYCILCNQRPRVYPNAFCVLCGLAVKENPDLALKLKHDPHTPYGEQPKHYCTGSLFDAGV